MDEKSNDFKPEMTQAANPMPKRLYTLEEAACYLGRSDWGMRDLIWGRKTPAIREGRKISLDIEDLNDYIRRNKTLYN